MSRLAIRNCNCVVTCKLLDLKNDDFVRLMRRLSSSKSVAWLCVGELSRDACLCVIAQDDRCDWFTSRPCVFVCVCLCRR